MKIGLALSGGGARGFAHFGVIKALSELGLAPDVISGVSAGALAGCLYAAGHSPEKALNIFISTKIYRFFRPAMSMRGFLKMSTLEKLYKLYLPEKFEDLSIPVTFNATDIQAGKTIYFSKGPLVHPLMASCCIPVMFEPMLLDNKLLVDGGILNNLPVEPLLNQCDLIIGIHTNPCQGEMPVANMRTVMERSLLLAIQNNIKERIELCDVFIEPPMLCRFTTLDSSRAHEIFEIGYAYTMEKADILLEAKRQKLMQVKSAS